MGLKTNTAFLDAFIELDNACCEGFGISRGGVTEYIKRLTRDRYATGRDDVLPRLIKYRNIRNKLAHEEGALNRLNELDRSDVTWLRHFVGSVVKGNDPVFSADSGVRRRKLVKRIVGACSAIAILGLAVLVLTVLKHFGVI